MPSKSHRAASRQAQLNRRKRRGKVQHREFTAEPVPTEDGLEAADSDPAVETLAPPEPAEGAVAAATQTSGATASTGTTRRARHRAASDSTRVYSYLGGELRQIGVITSFIVAILVALTFVLR